MYPISPACAVHQPPSTNPPPCAASSPSPSTPHRITSPARPQINVFLRIVRRREDGYHDLASLFHVIDLGA